MTFGGLGERKAPPPGWVGLALVGLITFLCVRTGNLVPFLAAIALIVMVMLHEFGHFVAARATGMKATEFFLGFGPRLWSTRRGETEYGVKAIPAGGYVRIIGMTNLEDVDPADEERTYRQKSTGARVLVASAGVLVQLVLALICFMAIGLLWGRPDTGSWQIARVQPGTPAARAELTAGDRIVSVDGAAVATFDQATDLLREHPGDVVELGVTRDGERRDVEVTLLARHPDTGERVGFLGVGGEPTFTRVGVVRGAGYGLSLLTDSITSGVQGVGKIFSPSGFRSWVDNVSSLTDEDQPATSGSGERVVSPVGVVRSADDLIAGSVPNALALFATINVFVALINLIPLPPFDGGHIAVALYEWVRSRGNRRYRVDYARLLPIAVAVITVMLMLGVTSLLLDIVRPVEL